jgi:hypothetical protein
MFPQWVPGAAARDAMGFGTNRGSSSPSGPARRGCFSGILSFVGVISIAGAALSWATEIHLGGFWTLVLVVASACTAFWLAYRTTGWMGVVSGIGFPILSAFAANYLQVFLNDGIDVKSLVWPIAVLVLVGVDQAVLRLWKR